MMLGRERASVEEGRVEGGGLMKGRNEVWSARGNDGREAASGGGIERGRGSKGGGGEGEQGREENFKGGIPRRAQCTVYSQTIPRKIVNRYKL